jgi:hypothetical protein
MSCDEHRDDLIDLARCGSDARDADGVRAHLERCPSCMERFRQQQALTAAFVAL